MNNVTQHELGRVLVTGGAGFIGSGLVWGLNARGIERVVIADRLGTSDKWRNLAPLRFEDYIEAHELLDALDRGALGRFDTVFHMGACSSTLERDASFLAQNNFVYTKRVAQWALANNTRFVYASSGATYGDGAKGMSDDVRFAQDLSVLRPLNPYGYSKQLFDQWALHNDLLHRMVGLKFFNVFGPNEDHKGEMRSLVHKAYGQIMETDAVQLFRSYRPEYAHGDSSRDFVYIKDVVNMSIHLAMHPTASGLDNIGSGIAHTWNALARALFSALNRDVNIEYIEMPEAMRDRYQYYTRADIGRLRATGFTVESTSLDDAIADYVRNYLMGDERLGDEVV